MVICIGADEIPMSATFRRLGALEVQDRLAVNPLPLVLDVRREEAFHTLPQGIIGAVPLVIDRQPIRLPDIERSRPIIVYCL